MFPKCGIIPFRCRTRYAVYSGYLSILSIQNCIGIYRYAPEYINKCTDTVMVRFKKVID